MASRFNENAPPVKNTNAAAPPPVTSWPFWAPEQGSSILLYLFYTSLIMLVIGVILLIVHFTVYPVFSFLPGDPGIIPLPTTSDKQVSFTKSPAGNDVSGGFTKIVPCGYTLSMDLYLTGEFAQQQTSPRIIMYNSLRPVTSMPTKDNLATTLPQANLVVWLDPLLNDLYASVITLDRTGGNPVVQTTQPIVNVPMKSPFRVTYVYDQNFLEVYVNGYMETSMAFQNKPRGLSTSAPFYFGHISSRTSCLVGNVNYWPRELPSREVMANGSPSSTVAFFNPT
jgi:hypothetical protein